MSTIGIILMFVPPNVLPEWVIWACGVLAVALLGKLGSSKDKPVIACGDGRTGAEAFQRQRGEALKGYRVEGDGGLADAWSCYVAPLETAATSATRQVNAGRRVASATRRDLRDQCG